MWHHNYNLWTHFSDQCICDIDIFYYMTLLHRSKCLFSPRLLASSTPVEIVNTPDCWGQQLPTLDHVLYSNHRLLTFWCMQTNSHLIMGPSTFKWVFASTIPTIYVSPYKIHINLMKTVWFTENNLESRIG